jgi:hypothetical protein
LLICTGKQVQHVIIPQLVPDDRRDLDDIRLSLVLNIAIQSRAVVLWGMCDDLSTPQALAPFYEIAF